MSGYIGNIPTPQATQTRDVFTATAGQTSFATSGYTPGFLDVYLNGVHLVNGTDYTASNGSDVVLSSGATAGDNVEVVAYTTFEVVDQSFSGNFSVDGSTFVVDAANNRVGVGTSSPSAPLDVLGRFSVNQVDGSADVRIAGVGNRDAELKFLEGATQRAYLLSAAGSDNLIFGTGTTERMRIDASGNVGIGPSATNRLALEYNFTSGLATVGPNSTGGSTSLAFGTSLSGSFAERMRLDASGNLLVGTTVAAGNKTHIAFDPASQNGMRFSHSSGTYTNSAIVFVNHVGSTVGGIKTNGTTTAYNTSSDYRLKENVVPLAGAADRLAQIPVHRFNFIADPDTTVDGFLAHEVQAFVPEAVTGTKDEVDDEGNPKYQGIDQSKLVPLLTAALQEALADIATLKAEVAALKGEPA